MLFLYCKHSITAFILVIADNFLYYKSIYNQMIMPVGRKFSEKNHRKFCQFQK